MKISRKAHLKAKAELLAAMMKLAGVLDVKRIYEGAGVWKVIGRATTLQLARFAADEAKYEQGR